ncbi:MAG: CRTAC1 family protein [Thermoplasmatota archaeon]
MRASVALVFVAANAIAALGLPTFMAHFDPVAPMGYQGRASPSGGIGARFEDVTAATGIDVRRQAWGDAPSYPQVITGGIAAADVDGNGFVDLYFPPGGPGNPGKLYLNEGNWTFREAAGPAGLALSGWGAGAAFGDYDNDGRPDLAVLVDDALHLLHNDGGSPPRFTDVTTAAGVSLSGLCGNPCMPSSVTWLDASHSGHLDLFLVNNLDWHDPSLHTSGADYGSFVQFGHAQRTVLFHNLRNGTFRDVTVDSGAWDAAKGLGVTTADMEGRGWTDILTANDHTPDAFLKNVGNGSFRNVASLAGVDEVTSSMGIQAADVNGDGRPDLVVTNFRGEEMSLFVQNADGTFTKQTDSRGLAATGAVTGWGLAVEDFDLDGWPDIAMAVGRAAPLAPHANDLDYALAPKLLNDTQDLLFANVGAGQFVDATAAGRFGDANITRALLAVDLDNSGALDVVRVNTDGAPAQVLRNRVAGHPGWLELRLQGSRSNRDGFGAVVTATTPDGRSQVREMAAAAGYETGLDGRLTFGLGAASSARVSVHWPDGTNQDVGSLPTGLHLVVEG